MRSILLRSLLIAAATLGLGACQLVYKLPTRQGNVIEQKQLDQLKPGMTREQVRFLLGTPVAASPFEDRRWDYLGYYRSPRGDVQSRVVSVYFENDIVARTEGTASQGDDLKLETPDVKTVIRQEKKAANEDAREESERKDKDTGVIIERK